MTKIKLTISAKGIDADRLNDKPLWNGLLNELAGKLGFPGSSLSLENVSIGEKETECQEPNCREPATDSWGGLAVCRDHYEQYKAKQDADIMSMNDY